MAHLRRQVVSRRRVFRGAVGAAAGGLLLGSGTRWSERAVAAVLADTGTVAGGFLVNGRHLSFGDDPAREMWAGGQPFNINTYNEVPPRSIRVWVDYGRDRFCGHTVEAEIRELLTHVPVWDGKPGVLRASRTLNADQFFVHARMAHLQPGTQYHYRFRYAAGHEIGTTAGATFLTAPGEVAEPFAFTAFADGASPGPRWTATRLCCPSPTGACGTTARTTPATRTGGPHPPRHDQHGDHADHPRPQPDQRHPGVVQPAGRRPVLRAGPG